MVMHGEQLGEDFIEPVLPVEEDSTERPTAEFQKSAARTGREARGEVISREAALNPTPMPALDALTNIRVLTDTYRAKVMEYGAISAFNRRTGRSNSVLYRELIDIQMKLADLMRAQEAKENPQPGPCEVLGYTMDEFMDRFGDMVRERKLGDLDEVLRFMAPIRNPHLSSKKANQAIFEIISQLTFRDELKEEWTSQPL